MACHLVAAGEPGLMPPYVDKSTGEEDAIRRRDEWFIKTHALDRTHDARGLRAASMQDQQRIASRAAPELLSTSPRWQSVGPRHIQFLDWAVGFVAGRVSALGVRPGDDNVLYLGAAAGGLWKSTTGGTTWTRLSNTFDSPSIGSVLVVAGASTNQDQIWVGTGEPYAGGCYTYFGRGLYYSNNGGASFSSRNGSGLNQLNLSVINAIALKPGTGQTLLAGGFGQCGADGSISGSGIYRTTDNGLTWSSVFGPADVTDVIYNPNNGSIVYAAANGGGVYKSTDAGDHWSQLTGALPVGAAAGSVRLAMAPSDPNTLYALAGNPVGLYKTANGGTTWTLANANACEGQCDYNLTLDISPTDVNTVLVGTIRPALSTNGGTTLNFITERFGSAQRVHQDTHVVRFSSSNSKRVWIGSDGGLWRSDDLGGNYTNLSDGLNIAQYYDIALDPRNPDRVYGGAQDDASQVRSDGDNWAVTVQTGDGFMNAVENAIGADNGRRVFQNSYPDDTSMPSVNLSANYGAPNTFDSLATNGIGSKEPFPWVTPMAVTQGMLFIGSNYLYRSATNQNPSGWIWTKVSPDLTGDGSSISVIDVTRADGGTPLRVYVGTDNGHAWRTDNALAANPVWTDISAGLPASRITGIAAVPGNADTVYVTRSAFGSAQLYRSSNAGTTWQPGGTGLPNVPATCVIVDSENSARVFVGTDIGVYESVDNGSTFTPMMLGLPFGAVVSTLRMGGRHVLVAGTYGTGAWKIDLVTDRIFADSFGQ
ncbi:hypothetical protein GCM10009105_32240 [Dokdonella soli]|uniref:Sortilin N-terminal domain-containing protein n=2 Tax=Dokdonella soli TaxID=529810 RepID=A0ABN1IV70_9GAMM